MSEQVRGTETGISRSPRFTPVLLVKLLRLFWSPAKTLVLVAATVSLVVGTTVAGVDAAVSSPTQSKSRDVELTVESGLEGVIGMGVPVPVRATITSRRAQVVTVEFSTQFGQKSTKLELAPDAPSVLDVALSATPMLDIAVRSSRGANLATRSVELVPDGSRTAVGVGPSLYSKGVPDESPTIGGIQKASLVPLTDELLARPGALDSLSAVVLDAGDLDGMSEGTGSVLREWVWRGGDLVLDVEPRADLPVIGEPAMGKVTPIGSGWVRFTSGAAELGAWSSILEPAPIRAGFNAGMGADFTNDFILDSGLLVTVGFIPTWVVALAVFGSAVVGGPIAWYLLGTHRRRKLIWWLAPGLSLVVALALLVAGNGVFTGARTRTVADIDVSMWSSRGRVFSGLKSSKTVELADGAQLLAARPTPLVTGSGSASTVRLDLPRNSFGSVAVSGVSVDAEPRIEVTAVALDDGSANVTVKNNSDAEFRNVTITGSSRVREFKSVKPGASETLPFQMTSELSVFNQVFMPPPMAGMESLIGWSDPLPGLSPTQSRGLVLVAGEMESEVDAAGLSGEGMVAIRVVVPVQPAETVDGTAALRLDEVGGLAAWQRQQVEQQGFMNGFEDMATTVVGPNDGGLVEQPPDYVRLTSQRGRTAQTCGVATNVGQVDAWNGTAWAPLEKVGTPYIDKREVGFQGEGHEMQDWMIPAVEPGGRLHLRVSGWVFPTPASMLFQCGGRP